MDEDLDTTSGEPQEAVVVVHDREDIDRLGALDLPKGSHAVSALPFGYTVLTGEQIGRVAPWSEVLYVRPTTASSTTPRTPRPAAPFPGFDDVDLADRVLVGDGGEFSFSVSGSREDGGDLSTAGQTIGVEPTVGATATATVRDRWVRPGGSGSDRPVHGPSRTGQVPAGHRRIHRVHRTGHQPGRRRRPERRAWLRVAPTDTPLFVRTFGRVCQKPIKGGGVWVAEMELNRRTLLKSTGAATGAMVVGTGSTAGATGPNTGTVDDALDTDSGRPQEVLVVFTENEKVDLLDQFDLPEGYHKFEVLPIGYTKATGDQLAEIARLDAVKYVEANRELEWHNDDAREVTGAGAVQDELGYTGETAHVAVIDTGVDSDHPDLQRNLQHNYRYLNPFTTSEATTWVDTERTQRYGASGVNTDDNGHGTHTSGTVAGDGTASAGQFRGMAPDADLTVYSAGLTLFIVKTVASYDHLIANHAPENVDDQDEAVYVVNNSWGVDSEALFNPSGGVETATKAAYEAGILSVFSAGNAGPGTNTLNDYAKAPYNLSVAATNDAGEVTSFSSRGLNPDSPAYSGDRKAALENLEEYEKLERAGKVGSWEETARVGPGSDAGGLVSEDLTYGESTFVEWTPSSDTGAIDLTAEWTNTRQDIDVFVRKGGRDGPIVANSTNGQLLSGCGETCEALTSKRIEGGADYTIEINPWASVQDTVDLHIDEFAVDAGDSTFEPGDPIGLYRNGVGAPGAHVMSTLDPAAPLQGYPALHLDDHPEEAVRNTADQGERPFYGHLSGTSMSAPVVTGIATLVVDAHKLQNGTYPSPAELLRFLEATADHEPRVDHSYNHYTPANIGTGFVDAEAAVKATVYPDGVPSWDDVNDNVVTFGNEIEVLSVTGVREDDGDVFTAGQTDHIDLTVGDPDDADDPSHRVDVIYDVIPSEWDVVPADGDDLQYVDGEPRTEPTADGNATRVYIDGSVAAGKSGEFTYFAGAPETREETGSYTFGPARASSDADDRNRAVAVSGTSDTQFVVGQSTETS